CGSRVSRVSPSISGMLMSLRMRSTLGFSSRRASASTPLCANTNVNRPSRICRRKRCVMSSSRSGSSSTTRILVDIQAPVGSAPGGVDGQHDDELGELAALGLDRQAAAVLLDDDVVTDGEAEPGALPGRLGGEKG